MAVGSDEGLPLLDWSMMIGAMVVIFSVCFESKRAWMGE